LISAEGVQRYPFFVPHKFTVKAYALEIYMRKVIRRVGVNFDIHGKDNIAVIIQHRSGPPASPAWERHYYLFSPSRVSISVDMTDP